MLSFLIVTLFWPLFIFHSNSVYLMKEAECVCVHTYICWSSTKTIPSLNFTIFIVQASTNFLTSTPKHSNPFEYLHVYLLHLLRQLWDVGQHFCPCLSGHWKVVIIMGVIIMGVIIMAITGLFTHLFKFHKSSVDGLKRNYDMYM